MEIRSYFSSSSDLHDLYHLYHIRRGLWPLGATKQQTLQNLKQAQRGRVYPPLPPSLPVLFGRSLAPLECSGLSWHLQILRKTKYKLLMGPFGSDQSRHVDDFGVKNHNFIDFVAKKSSFGRLFDEKKRLRASIYRWPHLFIDGPASIYRWPHLFIDGQACICKWTGIYL